MLNGNVVLPEEVYGPVLGQSRNGVLAATPDLKFYLLLEEHLEVDALFSWNCACRSPNFEADHAWSRSASGEELLQKALDEAPKFPRVRLARGQGDAAVWDADPADQADGDCSAR
jgi:hypothetical protein